MHRAYRANIHSPHISYPFFVSMFLTLFSLEPHRQERCLVVGFNNKRQNDVFTKAKQRSRCAAATPQSHLTLLIRRDHARAIVTCRVAPPADQAIITIRPCLTFTLGQLGSPPLWSLNLLVLQRQTPPPPRHPLPALLLPPLPPQGPSWPRHDCPRTLPIRRWKQPVPRFTQRHLNSQKHAKPGRGTSPSHSKETSFHAPQNPRI